MPNFFVILSSGSGSSSTSTLINSDVLTAIGTLLSQVWTWIIGNPGLTLFFTLSLVGTAFGLFRGLKRVAR